MPHEAADSITIGADKSSIMSIIADFDRYPEWTGSIKQANVIKPGANGRAQQVHFILDAGILRDDYVLDYDWNGDDSVSWHLVHGRALKAQDGTYTLTTETGGSTLVTYQLSIELGIPMLGMFKRKAEKVIIDTALKELKKRAEG